MIDIFAICSLEWLGINGGENVSSKQKYACDTCGKEVDNPYEKPDWMHVDIRSITRAHGVYEGASYKNDFLGQGTYDFCDWNCFKTRVERRKESVIPLPDWPEKPKELTP